MESTSVTVHIVDTPNDVTYTRGSLLGKGAFGVCYEVTKVSSKEIFACKIVSKIRLRETNTENRIIQEISIHSSLQHRHVVQFISHFEDNHNYYIILEHCAYKSLSEMQKRRGTVLELEARYYLRQILSGVNYLHKRNIIHRDLKLGNIFINNKMNIKIGDFGLSSTLQGEFHRRKTFCGTVNYTAPEIVTQEGHGQEVDIWSVGCIFYTFLVGTPPFSMKRKDQIYRKIIEAKVRFPRSPNNQNPISKEAKDLVLEMLQKDPRRRPKARELLQMDYIKTNCIPQSLPESALTTVPRLDNYTNSSLPRPPSNAIKNRCQAKKTILASQMESLQVKVENILRHPQNSNYGRKIEKPKLAPILWIVKWYSAYERKFGFSYQLSDGSSGVSFNDNSQMILLSDEITLQYVDCRDNEYCYTKNDYPEELWKKVQVFESFLKYMKDNLISVPLENVEDPNVSMMTRLPTVFKWFHTTQSTIMLLTNGTLQINKIDHTKIILCPILGAITILKANEANEPPVMRTFKLSLIEKYGCTLELRQHLHYSLEKLQVLTRILLSDNSLMEE